MIRTNQPSLAWWKRKLEGCVLQRVSWNSWPGQRATGWLWLPDPKCTTRYSTRDFGAEVAAAERMRRAGFNGPDPQGRWNLHGESAVVRFFARDYPR